jgi:GTP-binding protein YchF
VPVVGLFGTPDSGKSTVFKALTRQSVAPQFLGVDLKPHQAVVKIPDPRMDKLVEIVEPRSVVHATFEFVDIPGFDPTSTERKIKTAVLEHYRRCDALALVVNLYEVLGPDEPAREMRSLLGELALLDLVSVENAASRLEKASKLKADGESKARLAVLLRVKAGLEEGTAVRRMELDAEEQRLIRDLALLSAKPLIGVLNVADDDLNKPDDAIDGMAGALKVADEEGLTVLRLAASLEAALADMDDAEAAEYIAEFNVAEPGLPRFIRAAFSALGLFTFFTAGEQEVRSWPLRTGSNAQQAAGSIHSDLARGFIRAETVAYDDFVQHGNLAGAKAAGKVRLEGKDYVVKDGDILLIRFNV